MEDAHLPHPVGVHHHLFQGPGLVDPALFTGTGDHIQFPGLEGRQPQGCFGLEIEPDPIQLGCPPEIGCMGLEFENLPRRMGVKGKGARPHGMGLKALVAQGFHGLFAHDEAPAVIGDPGKKENGRDGMGETNFHLVAAAQDHLHVQVVPGIAAAGLVRGFFQGKDHIFGGEFMGGQPRRLVEHHPLAQADGPDLFPAFHAELRQGLGQIRSDLGRPAGQVSQQPVEDHVRQGPILGAKGKMGIQPPHGTDMGAEPQHLGRTGPCPDQPHQTDPN